MQKIKVRLQEKRRIYIHNDIANIACHFRSLIRGRLERDDREGITLEVISGLVMIAFAVEARVNFIGFKQIKNWQERKPFLLKIEDVCRALNIAPDWDSRQAPEFIEGAQGIQRQSCPREAEGGLF